MSDEWPSTRRADRHRSSRGRISVEPSPGGYRQQRRTQQRKRKRSRTLRWVLLVVVVLGLAAAGVLEGPRLLSRKSSPGGAPPGPKVTTAAGPEVVLLRLLQDQASPVTVLIDPAAKTKAVVGLPGDTLLQDTEGFAQLEDMLTGQGGLNRAAPAVAAVLGLKPLFLASVDWAKLRTALADAGSSLQTPAKLSVGKTSDAEAGAKAVAALAKYLSSAAKGSVLAALQFGGDSGAVTKALTALGGGAKVVAGLPGREVEGAGFSYYEVSTTGVKTILGGPPEEDSVSVELQNGSGAVGVTEQAAKMLAPLGYTMLPQKNADDFPDVGLTQVLAGVNALAEADTIRQRLGVGKVIRQDALPPKKVVVIVGKDLTLDSLRKAATTTSQ